MLLEITGRVMISRVRAAAENVVRSRNLRFHVKQSRVCACVAKC